MKPLYISFSLLIGFILLFPATKIKAQNPFITVWKTDNPGTKTNDDQIIIPAFGQYDYVWFEVGNASNIGIGSATNRDTITFPQAGTYQLEMTPKGSTPFNRYYVRNYGDPEKLIEIKQWGNVKWRSFENAFWDAVNLDITATDIPDLALVTNMSAAFNNSGVSTIPNLNDWDMSHVVTTVNMFKGAVNFNTPIGNWNVSNVESMVGMFYGAVSFNQPLNNWNVGKVKEMTSMFNGATSFNQPLNNWDVSKVKAMNAMFRDAVNFDQPLDNWQTDSLTSMNQIFYGATSFNQPIGGWDVSRVENMSSAFAGATEFNQPLENWDMSSVTNINSLFYKAVSFNQPIGDWDVSNVVHMSSTFDSAVKFNQSIGDWIISGVQNIYYLFRNAVSFNQPIGNWDLSSATSLDGMFQNASGFNQPLNDWDISNVTYLGQVFSGASAFDQPLDKWDISGLSDRTSIVIDNCGMSCENYSKTLYAWANNPNIPVQVQFYVSGLEYGADQDIKDAHTFLGSTRQWRFFGDEQGTCTDVLPVTISTFVAQQSEDEILLKWTTHNESGNLYFEVQRSRDGVNWVVIDKVGSKAINGNSSIRIDYDYHDKNPVNGENYYRLKQIDRDGKSSYSAIRHVAFNRMHSISVFPNPAVNLTTIKGTRQSQKIIITDQSGRVLQRLPGMEGETQCSLHSYAKGKYLIQIFSGNEIIATLQVMKQ